MNNLHYKIFYPGLVIAKHPSSHILWSQLYKYLMDFMYELFIFCNFSFIKFLQNFEKEDSFLDLYNSLGICIAKPLKYITYFI